MPLLDTLSGSHGVGLVGHELNIAPSTYYRHREYSRHPEKRSQRERRDDQLKREIQRVYGKNYSVYGIRKLWPPFANNWPLLNAVSSQKRSDGD